MAASEPCSAFPVEHQRVDFGVDKPFTRRKCSVERGPVAWECGLGKAWQCGLGVWFGKGLGVWLGSVAWEWLGSVAWEYGFLEETSVEPRSGRGGDAHGGET
eukprot:354195-Chlamydomonas_euryale.AAC.9